MKDSTRAILRHHLSMHFGYSSKRLSDPMLIQLENYLIQEVDGSENVYQEERYPPLHRNYDYMRFMHLYIDIVGDILDDILARTEHQIGKCPRRPSPYRDHCK